MVRKTIIIVVVLAVVSVIVFFEQRSAVAQSSTNSNVVISVADPRPLAKAADILELKLGVGISYEDPAWVNHGDMMKAIDSPHNPGLARQNPGLKAVIPIGGSISVSLPIDARTRRALTTPISALTDLLRDHDSRHNPGKFRLVDLGEGDFSIVPDAARDGNGTAVAQRSPLDASVWLPASQRSGMETLQLICDSISSSIGQRVNLGTVNVNLFVRTTIRLGANGERARDILVRVFREMQWSDARNISGVPKVSWRLFYGPDTHDYALNLKGVEREVLIPTGGTQKEVVRRTR